MTEFNESKRHVFVDYATNPGLKKTALANQGHYNKALQAYEKALELNPNHLVAWSNKGRILYDLGR